jgi:multicomponent K+:H+ antiporter subunit D
MMGLVIAPVLVALCAGFALLFARVGGLKWQRLVNFAVMGLLLIAAIAMVVVSSTGVHQVYAAGNWVAPFGIVLVLDRLSALMVLLTVLLGIGALWHSVVSGLDEQGPHFHPLFQFLLFGLFGAFLTGDLFNLFVFFEVMLLASYGLLLHGGGRQRTKAGFHYVVLNLIGSTLFLFAVGSLYGALGTLNMADLAHRVAGVPSEREGLVAAAGLMLLVVFGLKAAMFPLYLWLPRAYTHTAAGVAALFAIMTKVGIYAIIRVHGTLFSEAAGPLAGLHAPWVLALGLITMVLAALGVMAARNLREQVAYLVLASVAVLLIAVGLNNKEALAAAHYYMIHSTLIAGGFFLLAELIAKARGEARDRFEPAPSMPRSIVLGSFFFFGAIAAAGMPPLSGFIGKVLVLSAAMDTAWMAAIFAVVLLGSLVMIVALVRSGSLLFYHTQELCSLSGKRIATAALLPVGYLFSFGVLLVIFGGAVSGFSYESATQLLAVDRYIDAVLFMSAVGGTP